MKNLSEVKGEVKPSNTPFRKAHESEAETQGFIGTAGMTLLLRLATAQYLAKFEVLQP